MRIAILEDDIELATRITSALEAADYSCHTFYDGTALIRALRRTTFDLFIFDWTLPKLNGIDTLIKLREELNITTPVLFLTNNVDEKDMISAFKRGADDYCVKPVSLEVLTARVGSLIRRSYPGTNKERLAYTVGLYTFYKTDNNVLFNNEMIHLSDKEFIIASLLFQHVEQPVSRDHLLEKTWNEPNVDHSRSLDVHISWIRKKLHLNKGGAFYLKPLYGFGYRLTRNDT